MLRCAAHTHNLEVDQNGDARPCCIFRGTWGNIQHLARLQETKKKFIESFNETVPECLTCWMHESTGFTSKRQEFNRLVYDNQQEEKILEIKFSNLCNLACTTCGPFASSTWGSKLKVVEIENRFNKHGQHRIDYYLDLIKRLGYTKLTLIGGEPTMDPHCYMLLDQLVELDKASGIHLSVITNGQDIEDFINKYAGKFRTLQINLSIDGMGQVYEYMRFPGTWINMLKTMSHLGAVQKSLPRNERDLRVSITYTFSVLNQFHYNDFKRWFEEESRLYCTIDELHPNRVDFPIELEPRVYDQSMLEDIAEDIRPAVKVYEFKNNQRPLKDGLELERDRPRGVNWATAGLCEQDLENMQYIIYDERRHHGRLESD